MSKDNSENSERGNLDNLRRLLFGHYHENPLLKLPPPPQHWKSCDSCKYRSFQAELQRVLDGHIRDLDGDYYSPDWLTALMEDLASNEFYEMAAKVKELKSVVEGLIANAGLEIPIENYY